MHLLSESGGKGLGYLGVGGLGRAVLDFCGLQYGPLIWARTRNVHLLGSCGFPQIEDEGQKRWSILLNLDDS